MANSNEINGGAAQAAGKVERMAGKALKSVADKGAELQADGAEREVEGAVQKTAGKVQDAAAHVRDAVAKVSDHATHTIGKITERAQGLYSQAADQARKANDQVAPFVRERPYPALAIAGAAGFVLGVILVGALAAPTTSYIRRRG